MTYLKTLCVAFIGLFGLHIAQAQDQASANTTDHKKTIKVTEKKEKIVVHKGVTYYVIDGMWHTKMKNRYILKTAPDGAKIDFIPDGGKLVTLAGKKYYKCRGVFYKRLKDGTYEIERP
ncbi:MAG: hypothetical protein QNJ57_12575 [Flavobacteriaceae bacterium]|nr:hypothetical protein [Flavobacteriaceae bacterium]